MTINTKKVLIIFIISFIVSMILGYMDYETVSILDLFKNRDNILALLMYTFAFTLIILSVNGLIWLIRRMVLKTMRTNK